METITQFRDLCRARHNPRKRMIASTSGRAASCAAATASRPTPFAVGQSWASERDSSPNTIDEGQIILAGAVRELVTLRSAIVAGLEDVTSILDDVAVSLRQLQRHELFIDGGRSWRAFWSSGDDAIAKLKRIPALLDSHAQ